VAQRYRFFKRTQWIASFKVAKADSLYGLQLESHVRIAPLNERMPGNQAAVFG